MGFASYVADLFHIYNVQMKYPETAVSFDVDKKQLLNQEVKL